MTQYPQQTTHADMIAAMRQCFIDYPEVEEEIRHYGIKRSFPNGQRCDLIFYKKSINILRFNRGAWMVRQNPMTVYAFDEVNKVIAKTKLRDVSDIERKAIPAIIAIMAQAPKWVRYDA